LEIGTVDMGCTVAVEMPAKLKVNTRFAQPLKIEKGNHTEEWLSKQQ